MKFMKQKMFLIITGCFLICSCSSIPPSASALGTSRTLILDGVEVSEDDVGGFTTWYCYDYSDYISWGALSSVLLEVGYYESEYGKVGFVLYDGGYEGKTTRYSREGIDYRWDWGLGYRYAFVIKPDGTGLYYDFNFADENGQAKARDLFKCFKR